MDEYEVVLMHFGTKGMKWGVRKKDRRARMEKAKEVRKATYDAKKKGYKTLVSKNVERRKSRMEKSKEVRKATYDAKKAAYKNIGEKLKSPTAKKVAVGTAVIAGTVAVTGLLAAHGKRSLADIDRIVANIDPAEVAKWEAIFNNLPE